MYRKFKLKEKERESEIYQFVELCVRCITLCTIFSKSFKRRKKKTFKKKNEDDTPHRLPDCMCFFFFFILLYFSACLRKQKESVEDRRRRKIQAKMKERIGIQTMPNKRVEK